MAMLSRDDLDSYWEQGCAVLRGFPPQTALTEREAEPQLCNYEQFHRNLALFCSDDPWHAD